MIHQQSEHAVLINKWIDAHFTEDQLKATLLKEGCDENEIEELTDLFRRRQISNRVKRGFGLLIIGCILGFLSCVFTVLGIMPEIKGFILYGLTSIGIILALWGGYYVFE